MPASTRCKVRKGKESFLGKTILRKRFFVQGGSPDLVVRADDSCLRGCGFKSRHYIPDGHDIFHIELLLKLYCLFEETENK